MILHTEEVREIVKREEIQIVLLEPAFLTNAEVHHVKKLSDISKLIIGNKIETGDFIEYRSGTSEVVTKKSVNCIETERVNGIFTERYVYDCFGQARFIGRREN